MIRIEFYLGGHLVREIAQVNMGPTAQKPYDNRAGGRYRWLLDGTEITGSEAAELLEAAALDEDAAYQAAEAEPPPEEMLVMRTNLVVSSSVPVSTGARARGPRSRAP